MIPGRWCFAVAVLGLMLADPSVTAQEFASLEDVAESVRYHRAECWRLEGCYPQAAELYRSLLRDFPAGAHRTQALQHLFGIGNYWLHDTRTEMERAKDHPGSKGWGFCRLRFRVWWDELTPDGSTSWGFCVYHDPWDKTKPLFNEEEQALAILEEVWSQDPAGPLADKALFLVGALHFFRKSYSKADRFLSELIRSHPASPFMEQCLELALIAKSLSLDGTEEDGRRLAEARQLIDLIRKDYPLLWKRDQDFFGRQLVGITYREADRALAAADFWRRTGQPGTAQRHYEAICREYPNLRHGDDARERLDSLQIADPAAPGIGVVGELLATAVGTYYFHPPLNWWLSPPE